ncbi:MAG: TIGR03915 family putative DNA repair protein [Treponema sp.]|jgi:probable DNA metabolism protein|nr:TIGR03915 family putative DNA repair protein [Treponema sp.]
MSQTELFEDHAPEGAAFASYLSGEFDAPPGLSELFELSVDAYYAVIHATMSGLPIKREINRFIEKVRKAENRDEAARAASDRGDADVLVVLKAAYKVTVEIHRLTGLLRFSPDSAGVYIARCSPDYFILPALAEHFTLRFGETPWAIIDEKRKLCLEGGRLQGDNGAARLTALSSCPQAAAEKETDSWEELWRLYHHSVNNEGRKNPRLQRQLMPERYHKYLPEMKKP